jgi:WD40 repeat protein
MELKSFVPQEHHPKAITCIVHHIGRKEILTGSEDSLIRSWDSDTGRQTGVFSGHSGWVTSLVYWYAQG